MKKIVLITTGQPATNPRLVKEADALATAGYAVTVLYCYVIQWAADFDREILSSVAWRHQLVGGSPEKSRLLFLKTKVRHKLASLWNGFSGGVIQAERAQARAYDELLRAAKGIKADLYIGHNLGALAVAERAAKYHGAKAGFDFEDYHRGECRRGQVSWKRTVLLENKYVPGLSYISCSSCLIAAAVKADHPHMNGRSITLLNCFSPVKQFLPENKSKEPVPLKLFWFSQTVGRNRGLETVMKALDLVNDASVSFTLVGRCSEEMKTFFLALAGKAKEQVKFIGPVPPDELESLAAQHDIGLACELSELPNRDLCLTNKIFQYVSTGLCVLASDTSAQKAFFEQYPSIGFSYPQGNYTALSALIQSLYSNQPELCRCKRNSLRLAADILNWERESEKLLDLTQQIV